MAGEKDEELDRNIYMGMIPYEEYTVKLNYDELNNLVVILNGNQHGVKIDFGYVRAVNILDEYIVLKDILSDDNDDEYNGFRNIIYKVNSNKYDEYIRGICTDLYDFLKFNHTMIVTRNCIVDVIGESVPILEVKKK